MRRRPYDMDHIIWSLRYGPYHVLDMHAKTLIHFWGITFGLFSHQVFRMKFDPLSYQWLHRKSKLDQRSFFEQFESGSNFILIRWSKNIPKICDASKVDQIFCMHIQHVIRIISYGLLRILYWIKVHIHWKLVVDFSVKYMFSYIGHYKNPTGGAYWTI